VGGGWGGWWWGGGVGEVGWCGEGLGGGAVVGWERGMGGGLCEGWGWVRAGGGGLWGGGVGGEMSFRRRCEDRGVVSSDFVWYRGVTLRNETELRLVIPGSGVRNLAQFGRNRGRELRCDWFPCGRSGCVAHGQGGEKNPRFHARQADTMRLPDRRKRAIESFSKQAGARLTLGGGISQSAGGSKEVRE